MLIDSLFDGTMGSIKVLDFGIAKILGRGENEVECLTKTGDVFGSPMYMSPEQCGGNEITPASDTYSLGCLMFEALTGTPPLIGPNSLRTMMLHQFEPAPTLREAALGKKFPDELESLIASMLDKRPERRPHSLELVAEQLRRMASGQFVERHSEPIARPLYKRVPVIIGSAVTLLAVVTLPILLVRFHEGRNAASDVTGIEKVVSDQKPTQAASPIAAVDDAKSKAYATEIPDADKVLQDFSDDNRQKAVESWERFGQIEIVKQDQKFKTIVFPDALIGKVLTNAPDSVPNFGAGLSAKGSVEIPVQQQVTLHLNERIVPALFANPLIFSKINKNVFDGLSLVGPLNERGSMGMLTPTYDYDREVQNMRSALGLFLQQSKEWTKLKQLFLRDLSLSNSLAKDVAELPHLEFLYLNSCSPETLSALKLSGVKRLHRLSLNNCGPVDSFLTFLSSSDNLEIIEIGYDTQVTTATAEIFGRFAHLKHLIIRSAITPELLSKLRSYHNIKQLEYTFEQSTRKM